jgi:argininosuccinate lyase
MAKLWQAGATVGGLDPGVEAFLSSLSIDSKLLDEDIQGSIAHASMLGETGILSADDARAIVDCLAAIRAEAADGRLIVDPESEDVHSFIEAELTRRLGEVGKAVHAGRSRNDQVATAFRLYVLKAFDRTEAAVYSAIEAIIHLAAENRTSLMPGYTHLQRAQPISLAHHLLAWATALERDAARLRDGRARADECPLGSGALAGSGLPVDRNMTAATLGFARPSRNTMDAVADRDACVEYAAACASLMVHLSRACEDIALWASSEYGFVRVKDSASTGSSIMPQKRNPDPAELIRGKSARVLGNLQALLVLQKGLSYAYNRDLQEDKELLFDLETTALSSLKAFAVLVSALEPRKDRMRKALDEGFLEATDVAEYLVLKGIPFRTAYLAAKALVQRCLGSGKRLSDLSAEEAAAVDKLFALPEVSWQELRAYIEPEACVARRGQPGGPAPERTLEEIDRLKLVVLQGLKELGARRVGLLNMGSPGSAKS